MSLPEPTAKVVTVIINFKDATRSPMKYALKVEPNEHPEHMRERLSRLSGIEPRKMLFAEFDGAAIYIIGQIRTLRIEHFAVRRNLLIFEIPHIKHPSRLVNILMCSTTRRGGARQPYTRFGIHRISA